MTEEELQNIAKQLSCPQGEEGIQVGVQMNDSNFEMTLQTLNRTQFESGDKVLELGHGNGGHLPTLLSRADNLTYDGLEISTVMQAQAQLLNANLVHDEVTKFHLYDGMFIPFPENTFQKIFTVNTIYFWKKPKVLLVEIFRVLQKEGHFSLAFATKEFMKDLPFVQYGFRLWETSELEALAGSIGFQHIKTIPLEDQARSKAGDLVQRKYVVMSFLK